MTLVQGQVLWTPPADARERFVLGRYLEWLRRERGLDFAGYDELWKWSVSDLEGFWASVWDFFEIRAHTPYERVLGAREMPGVEWFPGARLNFADHMVGRDEEEAKHVRRRWGVLFQGGALFSTLTVAENVQVPIKEFYHGIEQDLLDEIAAYKISMSGLAVDAGAKFPSELSGGMRKRAGIARALALDPELLFLDEPTAGLDPIGAAGFDQLILQLRDALGLTVFLITHDLDTLYAICDRVAVLADKKVVAVGTIPELLALDHEWIQEYFRGPRGRAAEEAVEAEAETRSANTDGGGKS